MKPSVFACIFALFCTVPFATAQQADPRQLGVLEEKVDRLNAQVEDLQFRQQQTQKEVEAIRAELQEVRRAAGGGANSADLKALEDRIQAVDAARQADKKAIIDQLAKELANLGGTKPASKPATSGATEHVVQKGDTLTTIAKKYGVTVAELRKANNLSGDNLNVGQKLTIPK